MGYLKIYKNEFFEFAVEPVTFGGLNGYVSGIVMSRIYFPPSNGVSGGPLISPRSFRNELSSRSSFTPAVSAWKRGIQDQVLPPQFQPGGRGDNARTISAACSQNTVTQNTVIWHRNCITRGKSTCVQHVLARWLATLVRLANQRASTCWTHVLLPRIIQCLCHITVIPLP